MRMPWYFLIGIFTFGMILTLLLARFDFENARASDDAFNAEVAASISVDVATQVGEFYTPTVAGEGFVAAALADSEALDVPQSEIIDASFPPFVEPIVEYLGPALIDYQLAPVGVVTYSARPEQNAAAIGHNLFLDDARRDDILRTVAARGPIVSGPVDLKQGGVGIIIRQAIFIDGLTDFPQRYAEFTGDTTPYPWQAEVPEDFWGFATTVVDFSTLLAGVDFRGLDSSEYAIRVPGVEGQPDRVIAGDLSADSAHRVTQPVLLPDGSVWFVDAGVVRTAVWQQWPIVLAGLAATLVLTILSARSYTVRQRDRVGHMFSRQLAQLHRRSEIAAATGELLQRVVPTASVTVVCAHPDGEPAEFSPDEPGSGLSQERVLPITYGGDEQAVIIVKAQSTRVISQAEEVVDVIAFILGATLAAVAQREELEEQGRIDHLTEVYNRRHFQPTFDQAVSVARERDLALSVAVVDVDAFKEVNDSRGHLVGDEVLRTLSRALSVGLRDQDTIFRFGGDEFVLLTLTPGESSAVGLFDRIQRTVNDAFRTEFPDLSGVTVSIGYVVAGPGEIEPMNEMLAKADQALYEAKAGGGDRISRWTPGAPAVL